jgi:hypothetical protein
MIVSDMREQILLVADASVFWEMVMHQQITIDAYFSDEFAADASQLFYVFHITHRDELPQLAHEHRLTLLLSLHAALELRFALSGAHALFY